MSEPVKIIFTRTGLIDGRCGLSRLLKRAGADKDQISYCNFSFSKDGMMDRNCEGYLAIKDVLGSIDIQLKGKYIKPQGAQPKQFKPVHKKFPDEYIEVVLNYIPDSFGDQDLWDACTSVFDGELNIVPDDQISPLESLDEEIIKCIESREKLPSQNAAKRLKEVWDELVLLPAPTDFKQFARELFNLIKDDQNHIIIRKNAAIEKQTK